MKCLLASNSISIAPGGGLRPCCAINPNHWDISKHKISDYSTLTEWINNPMMQSLRIDLSNDKWPVACSNCQTREKHGQLSTRQIFNNTLSPYKVEVDEKMTSDITLSDVYLVDMFVGNKCNSSCIMCNELNSSLWAREQETITGEKLIQRGLSSNWLTVQYGFDLVDQLHNMRVIQIIGGEPTVNFQHINILEQLVERSRSHDISLGYVTNLTGVTPELVSLWSKFGIKNISVSVDGVGPVNEYIRYPFSWEKVNTKLDALMDISTQEGKYNIGLSHTITPLNLISIDTVIDWWEDKVSRGDSVMTSTPHIHCVNHPEYMDPIYMPPALKDECRESLDRLEAICRRRNLGDKYTPVIDNIRTNVLDKEVNEVYRQQVWLRMQKFITDLDKHRNRDIFKYLPFIEKHWIK